MDILDQYGAALELIEFPGKFACQGVIDPFIQPLIQVSGMDDILGWPLPTTQVNSLLSCSAIQQAAYGKGSDTVIDPAVRDAWVFKSDAVQFGNSQWDAMIDTLAAGKIKNLLGIVSGSVRAELYNLVVYKPGGKFLPHRDTEKAPGMFGTLVIVMPCKHEGGDLVINHSTETPLRFSAHSLVLPEWVAFYADCEHELEPVTSGYRVALVYNLIRKGSTAVPEIPNLIRGKCAPNTAIDELRATASRDDDESKHVLLFQHKYTQAALDWDSLKGLDAAYVSAFAASKAFDLFLTTVTYTFTGDDMYEEVEREYEFQNGAILPHDDVPECIAKSIRFFVNDEEEVFGGRDALLGIEAAGSEHEGYTGNDGAPMSRWYKHAALVFWPKINRLKFISKYQKLALVEAYAAGDYEPDSDVDVDIDDLLRACIRVGLWNDCEEARVLKALVSPLVSPDWSVSFITSDLQLEDVQRIAPMIKALLLEPEHAPRIANAIEAMCKRLCERSSGFESACSLISSLSCPLLGESVTALVTYLKEMPAVPAVKPSASVQYANVRLASIKLRKDGVSTLLKMLSSQECYQALFDDAVTNIEANCKAFPVLTVIVPALAEVSKGVVLSPEAVQRLKGMVVNDLKNTTSTEAVDRDSLTSALMLTTCSFDSALLTALVANPTRFPPATTLLSALQKVLQSHSSPAVLLVNSVWSDAVMEAAKAALQSISVVADQVKAVQTALTLTALCETHGPAAVPSVSERLLQILAEVVPLPAVVAPAVIAYAGALRTAPHPNIGALIERVASNLDSSGMPLPDLAGRNWSIDVALPCTCALCKQAEEFLRHPLKDKMIWRGRNVSNERHLTLCLERLAGETGEFAVVLTCSDGTNDNGSLDIVKNATGRVSIEELQQHSQLQAQRTKLRDQAASLCSALAKFQVHATADSDEHAVKRSKGNISH